MVFRLSRLSLPLMAALALAGACREAETYGGPLGAPAGSTGGGAGASAGTGAAAPSSAGATLAALMGNTVTGSVTFTKGSGTDVVVTVTLSNCVAGKSYPVHIHEGKGCADAMAQGEHWGPQRGEGIPNVMCGSTTGMSMLTRSAAMANLAWTIGGETATNVIGHAFVVHAPDMPMPARIACGVIAAK